MHTWKSGNQTLANSIDYPSWILAARPKTLVASAVPVFVAGSLGFSHGSFDLLILVACLLCSLCLQIATNFINDAADFERGADTATRVGPARMAQSGRITTKQLYGAAFGLLSLTFLLGTYLVWLGGWPIVFVGIASILSAVAYTSGPYALAYYGLGDLFVLLFFGLIAVGGTYYLLTHEISSTVLVVGMMIGLHITSLIVVNNARDIEEDRKVGKKTIAARLGLRKTQAYYSLIIVLPYLVLPILSWKENFGLISVLPLFGLPLAVGLINQMYSAQDGESFNLLLERTGKHMVLFSGLYCFSILISNL